MKIFSHFSLANLKTLHPTRHSRDSTPGNDQRKTLAGYQQTGKQSNARLNLNSLITYLTPDCKLRKLDSATIANMASKRHERGRYWF